jgi:DNA-binding IclR family transcriptional regulator
MQYVQRVVDILASFISEDSELGISELSRRLGYSKSIIHRILTSLEEAGYVVSNPNTRRYRLGFKIIQLGLAAQNQSDIRRVSYPRMKRLCELTLETVTLSVMADNQRTYLEIVPSPQEIRQMVELGHSYPLYFGGSGKAILAFTTTERRERVLAEAEGHYYANGKSVDLDALRSELTVIREQGYATSRSERIAGAAAVAAPIFNHSDQVVGCISVAGPDSRLSDEELARFSSMLVAAANEISLELGHSQPIESYHTESD